jgi:hypothetical protein
MANERDMVIIGAGPAGLSRNCRNPYSPIRPAMAGKSRSPTGPWISCSHSACGRLFPPLTFHPSAKPA